MKTTGIIKIKLDNAIIMADAKRIVENKTPIKNINQLAMLMEARYPDECEYESTLHTLYKARIMGYQRKDAKAKINKIIDKICIVLGTTKESITEEIEKQ